MRGHGNEHIARSAQYGGQVRFDDERLGKRGLRQVSRIAPPLAHDPELRSVATPEVRLQAVARELDGKRRSPRTRSNDRHGRRVGLSWMVQTGS